MRRPIATVARGRPDDRWNVHSPYSIEKPTLWKNGLSINGTV